MKPKKFTGHLRSSPCCTGDATALQALPARSGLLPPYTLAFGSHDQSASDWSVSFYTPQCVIIITRKKIFPYISNTKSPFFHHRSFSLCKETEQDTRKVIDDRHGERPSYLFAWGSPNWTGMINHQSTENRRKWRNNRIWSGCCLLFLRMGAIGPILRVAH